MRQFRTPKLITLSKDDLLDDVERTLKRHQISAVPLLDEKGALFGILSTKDLLRATRSEFGD